MNIKNLIILIIINLNFTSFASSPDTQGEQVIHSSVETVYTVNEGQEFSFYIGLPSNISYKGNIDYNTIIMDSDEGIFLEINDNTIYGSAPEVDKDTVFNVITETEIKKNNFITRKFKFLILNK